MAEARGERGRKLSSLWRGRREGTLSLSPGLADVVRAFIHVCLNEPETLLCCSPKYLLLGDICCNT